MPKKDTSGDVRSLLSSGRDLRPPRADDEVADTGASISLDAELDTTTSTVDSTTAPVAATTGRARRGAAGRPARQTGHGAAPRTLRLSQAAADELREAWLDEKRHGADVLLSLQDFAGQVLDDGLRARGHRASS